MWRQSTPNDDLFRRLEGAGLDPKPVLATLNPGHC
jgi:hypothetical protein